MSSSVVCRWVVARGAGQEHVGSKCVNLWRMSEKMSASVPVPPALALPFSAWPRLLSLPENAHVAAALNTGRVTGREAFDAVQQVSPSLRFSIHLEISPPQVPFHTLLSCGYTRHCTDS
jgi:hypothetical protein